MSTPTFTAEQILYLRRVYPVMDIDPKHSLAEIQYNAGVQSVLRHIQSLGPSIEPRAMKPPRPVQ